MASEPENRVLTLLRDIRAALGEHRGLLLALADQGRRTERRVDATERRMGDWEHRFAELRDHIELMLKATLMGRGIKSRHTANEILKQAGLPKAF